MKKELFDKLKENIFLVLLGKSTALEFEKWLYEQEKIIELINENSFIYDLITLNYKNKNARFSLKQIAITKINYQEFIILSIEHKCNKIIESNEWENTYKSFYEIFSHFDYENDYSLMWEFYSINSRMDLIEIGYETKSSLLAEIKELAKKTINKLNKLNTSNEKIKLLINGFDNMENIELQIPSKSNIHKSIKWYQFWKN